MKKNKDYSVLLRIAIMVLITALASCNTNRKITGTITGINGNIVTVDSIHQFKINTAAIDTLQTGKPISFTSTVNRKKINSKRIHQ